MQKKRLPVCALVIIDILVFGVSLLVFAYFHHVRASLMPDDSSSVETYGFVSKPSPRNESSVADENSQSSFTSDVSDTVSDGETTEPPLPTYDASGDFGEKFGGLFASDNSVSHDENSYKSHDIYIEKTAFSGRMRQKSKKNSKETAEYSVSYYIYDIYIRNIENFKTGYTSGGGKSIESLSKDTVLSITGDNFKNSEFPKFVIRNGNILTDPPMATSQDICVIYWDGIMETYAPGTYKWDDIMAKSPYQCWTFGPVLIENGGVPSSYNTSVWTFNPRSAIGYVEPGHYVFVLADGRGQNGSSGLNLSALSELFISRGCVCAYNLDGGASAQSIFNGEVQNHCTNSRNISDTVCIGEVAG